MTNTQTAIFGLVVIVFIVSGTAQLMHYDAGRLEARKVVVREKIPLNDNLFTSYREVETISYCAPGERPALPEVIRAQGDALAALLTTQAVHAARIRPPRPVVTNTPYLLEVKTNKTPILSLEPAARYSYPVLTATSGVFTINV